MTSEIPTRSGDIFTLDDETQILNSVEKWLDKEVKDEILALDHADEYPRKMVEQMKTLGLFGATISQEYGGLGMPCASYAKVVTAVSEVWMSLTGIFNSHLIMAAAIERFGTNEQKHRFLPRFATGELRGGIALTEPNCGTDLQAITTKAEKKGDKYIINGSKTWISNGIEGDCVALLVKTDSEIRPRHKGMSLFLAEKAAGFSVGCKLKKLGYKGIDSAELFFDDYVISADNLVGGKEGRGFHQTVSGLELGRINIAARGVGVANASLNAATAYAQTRETMGKPIGQHQAIQTKLGDMATRCQASRLLVEDAARAYDRGERCDMEAGMAKLFASESAMENAAECMRIHGAYGYSRESHVERYYRDAPLMCIGEGTNEMQRIIIAKQLLERNPV